MHLHLHACICTRVYNKFSPLSLHSPSEIVLPTRPEPTPEEVIAPGPIPLLDAAATEGLDDLEDEELAPAEMSSAEMTSELEMSKLLDIQTER